MHKVGYWFVFVRTRWVECDCARYSGGLRAQSWIFNDLLVLIREGTPLMFLLFGKLTKIAANYYFCILVKKLLFLWSVNKNYYFFLSTRITIFFIYNFEQYHAILVFPLLVDMSSYNLFKASMVVVHIFVLYKIYTL